jgi:hypothetical protein
MLNSSCARVPCSKMSETDKLKHLIHIVRLLIEVGAPPAQPSCELQLIDDGPSSVQVGDDGQAQSYFHRASALIHNCDDAETKLAYKLCNVRLARAASSPCVNLADRTPADARTPSSILAGAATRLFAQVQRSRPSLL